MTRRTFVSIVLIVFGADAIQSIAGDASSVAAPTPAPSAPKTTSAAPSRAGTRLRWSQRTGALRVSVNSIEITTGSTSVRPSRSVATTSRLAMTVVESDDGRSDSSPADADGASILTVAKRAYTCTGVGGNSTISSQYLPSTFIASTNPENVTGFVMNEFTPSR
jgi:hypothetical protein